MERVRLEYILKDYNKEKYQEVEDLQKEFLQKEPFKITYEEDVFYEIYYLKNENRYILLICTEDIVFKEIQYLLQKKAEYYITKNEDYIYAGISNLEYSESFLSKEEMQEMEDTLWYFTKSWPIIYELYNNLNEYSLEIVGNFEIYNGLTSIYRVSFKNKDKALEYLKTVKAFLMLEKDTNKYLIFKPIISEKEGLKFTYKGNDIRLKDNYKEIKRFTEYYLFDNKKFDKSDLFNELNSSGLIELQKEDDLFSSNSERIDSDFEISENEINKKYQKKIKTSDEITITTKNYLESIRDSQLIFDERNKKITIFIDDGYLDEVKEQLKNE